MREFGQSQPLRLCVVCDDETVQAAVRVSCPPPHEIVFFAMEGIVDAQQVLAAHGRAIMEAAETADVLLIAWHLDKAPVINTLCHHTRGTVRIPLIALCGGSREDQVAALSAGADDAMTFPLYLPLILMKVVAYHRLVESSAAAPPVHKEGPERPEREAVTNHVVRQFGKLRLDRQAHRFFANDQLVPLTPREFELLDYLLENANAVCTRRQILDHVWAISFDTGTNMVDVYTYFLRKKLAAHGLKGMIQTVRGYGYRLTLNEPERA